MKDLAQSSDSKFETWNIMEYFSWILYSLAIIAFILVHQNVLELKTLVTVPMSGNSVTFGFPSLIFVLGAFFNIWAIYIKKKIMQEVNGSPFFLAIGFTLSVSFIAFLVVLIITFIELKLL